MDPLSITASSIAVAHVVRLSIKGVLALRRANPDLIALHNEISDLVTVLHELESVWERQLPIPEENVLAIGVLDLIVQVKSKLEHLSTQVSKWSNHSTTTTTVSPRRRLETPYQARKFKEEFRSLRDRISNYLAVVGISSTSRIELNLRQILLLAKRTDQTQQSIEKILSAEDKAVASGLEFPGIQSLGFEESGSNGCANGLALPTENADDTVIDLGSTRAFKHNGHILFDTKQLTAVSAVGIRTAQFPRTACTPWCSCICHSESRIETPKILQSIFGRLFIGYSGIPVLTKPCDQKLHCVRAQPLSYVTYFFPQWFLARMVSLMLTTTTLAGPVMSLKVQRTVPGNAAILTQAKLGNVDEIKNLFQNGLASPHDVHYDSGVTALHLALSHRRVAVCKFLLDMNADPFLEDRMQRTAADNAWDKILMRSFSPETERMFRLMFSETECIQRREFTALHKVVLGLASGDLSKMLGASTAEIDAVDTHGRTSLSMAAGLGDRPSIRTLLKYKADVNIPTTIGGTALHFAAHNKDPECISLLINAGAKLDACTDWRQTPLIFAAAYSQNPRHAELLLDAGASIDFRDLDGITALGWSAIVENVPVAKLLLQRGADITNIDCNGDTVISLCVASNRVKILQLLNGRDLGSAELTNAASIQNMLLSVAENATSETMRILCQLNLEGVEIEATDESGNTWRQILDRRPDYNDTVERAMNELVKHCTKTQLDGTVSSGYHVDDDLIYEDALEFQV